VAADETAVDLRVVDQLADGDPEVLLDLVETYLIETSALTAKLKAAITAGASHDAERLAHSCAGASAQLGVVSLVPVFRRLEALAHAGSLADTTPLVTDLDRQLGRVEAVFRKHAGLSDDA
jgi:HPt (histidine-containing phosphotransfer) domain-containing protein